MKSLIFLFLITPFPVFAVDYENEIKVYVSVLNRHFDLDVKVMETPNICPLGIGKPDNQLTIVYCKKDLEVMKVMDPKYKPLESLYTMIGHEYSHILLDFDKSSDARKTLQASIAKVTQRVHNLLLSDLERQAQLKSLDEEAVLSLNDSILNFISNILHENVDALGIKLTEMAAFDSNPRWPELYGFFPSSSGSSFAFKAIVPRMNNMVIAERDGLERWSNFNCLGTGYSYKDSNSILKEGLRRAEKTSIISDLEQGCSTEDGVRLFFEKLDEYAPIIK